MSGGAAGLRIVFLIRAMTAGGAERQLINLCRGLCTLGHTVCVATYYRGGALEPELRATGAEVRCLDKGGRWDLLPFFRRFVRLLDAFRPDVVYGFMPTENLVALAARAVVRPRPRVVYGIRAADASGRAYGWTVRAVIALQRLTARQADGVISNSRAGLEALGVRLESEHSAVIANGIDSERFRPDARLRERGRAAASIPSSAQCIGMVARLDPLKGHSCFLEAARLVAKGRPDARFLVVGDGPAELRAALEARAAALGIADRVCWQSGTAEPEVVYNAMDVLVSASESESFPNVIAEAMACGVPVVATDVGESAAIVGEFGVRVAVGDSAAMAEGIRVLLADKNEDRSARMRASIIDRYGLAALASGTEQFLNALTSGRGARDRRPAAGVR